MPLPSSEEDISKKKPRTGIPGFFNRIRCLSQGHFFREGKYEDKATWAQCLKCHLRKEPVERTDGCTRVWDPLTNGYRCQHSEHPGARAWGGLCPAHQKAKETENPEPSDNHD